MILIAIFYLPARCVISKLFLSDMEAEEKLLEESHRI